MNQKLFDYLQDEFNLPPPIESELREMTDIVLEEEGLKWIPVTERLPESGQDVLMFTVHNRILAGWYTGDEWDAGYEFPSTTDVIAWMSGPCPYIPSNPIP